MAPSIKPPVVITGGLVYDGTLDPPRSADIRLEGETIAAIGENLPREGCDVVDAGGKIVSPGLIDLHVHVYDGVGIYSIDPAEAGLRTGVTTMLDAGSAGSLTMAGFHKYVMPAAEEDVFALLNISQLGVQGNPSVEPFIGELTDIRHLHVPSCTACVEQYRDRVIGTKARLSANLAAENPEHEWHALRGAVAAAEQTGTLVMIHHKGSNISVPDVLAALRPGDIYTHLYHPDAGSCFDPASGTPLAEVSAARERGIVFDCGHGVGSFAWSVAERVCGDHGFWPDTISTDIHRLNLHGPVYDMPTTMSKFLHLGMPLEEVIHRSTLAPAAAMRMDDRFGKLEAGRQADITLLELDKSEFPLTDSVGQTRMASEHLVARGVYKRGQYSTCWSTEQSEGP